MRLKKALLIILALIGIAALVIVGYRAWLSTSSRLQEESQLMPEVIQSTGNEVYTAEELPIYEYEQQEIEVMNQGQRIYGVAYIPKTTRDTVPLIICAHGLGDSYQSNLAYAEQLAAHGLAAYCFDFAAVVEPEVKGAPRKCRS